MSEIQASEETRSNMPETHSNMPESHSNIPESDSPIFESESCMFERQPLMVCMENASGDEVSLRVEPGDDCRTFRDKARVVLGYDIDLASLTKNQPVDLNENVYQFLLNLEKNHPEMVQVLDQTETKENQEYVLDDGTEIEASQIHFDNEDAPVDLTLEKLPFIRIEEAEEENNDADITYEEVTHIISASPIASLSGSPKPFISGVPFKLVCNNTIGFEAQFTRYLEESTKTYATLNTVTKKNKSPRSLIKDNFDTKDDFKYTRDEILNMLKDAPVTGIPYEVNEKKHVRKTDPTRMIQKSATKTIDIDGLVIADVENRNCFICTNSVSEKLYIFDKEDQKMHRWSPQKIMSTQLKVICEACLSEYFQPSRMKNANQFLNSEEYLVIKNNQQYIFQKIKNFKFQSDKESKIKNRDEFVKVEIGSDGEIVTKPIDNDDDVIIINDERKDSSSDVELVEEPEIDKIIDNLEDADDEVKQFLGINENDSEVKELKCRFCELTFQSAAEVALHVDTHKHDTDDDVVYPCPLCDYGYANSKWLKAHIKAVHEKKAAENKTETKNADSTIQENQQEMTSITNSAYVSLEKRPDEPDTNNEDFGKQNIMKHPDLIIKTEVKQECLSSDEEIWIVQTDATPVKPRKGHKCETCSKFFPSADTLATHQCRRGQKRKSEDEGKTDKDVVGKPQVPTSQDLESDNSDMIIERQRKKAKDHSEIVTCHNCNQSFTSKVRLKFHMQFHARDAPVTDIYACGECDLICDTETELFDHVHFQHDKRKRWQCPQPHCGKTFYLRATLTKHSRTHTDTRRYVCVKCGKRFFDKQTLDEHGVTHLRIKPYQCHICLKQLTRVSRLRMHVRAHRERVTPARAPVCACCARAFRDVMHAQEHASKSVECMEAYADYIKKENSEPAIELSPTTGLVKHIVQEEQSPDPMRRIKRQVESPIAEPLLSKLPDEIRGLIRIVEIDKAFRCEYCEDVFYIEEGLNKHREIHKGVKNPFTCHICKVSFATYSRCTTHKTTHGFYKRGGEARAVPDFPVVKHFLCEDCGRSYLHWTYLQVHRRMKHPNDNYEHKCNDCDMTFPNSWSLAYHRKKSHRKTDSSKTSTQNYRIPCRDCDEILPNKNALYKHRKKEHSEDSMPHFENSDPGGSGLDSVGSGSARVRCPCLWACARCGRRFRARAELRAHVRAHHPHHVAVIEIEGANPSPAEVMEALNANSIPKEKVVEINLMTFLKGTTNIVPNCARALSLLSNVPKTPVPISSLKENIANPIEEYRNLRRPTSLLTAVRRPSILQRAENTQTTSSSQNLQSINIQHLLQDSDFSTTQQAQENNDSSTQI